MPSFAVDDTYLFKQYFEQDEVFTELRPYYNEDDYRFEVPQDGFDDVQQYTRDELVDKLQALAEELDRSPTVADVRNALDYPSVSQFLDEFESWNAAKQAAGLETFRKEGRGKTYSDAELIEKLQQLADNDDGLVTIGDVNESDNCPSAVTYQRHFGS